jgi:hypothetical protein
MAKRLDLVIRPSEIKSVATAAGKDVPTLGSVTFQVKLGPALLDVKAHVLPAFLPSAHLIIGEDFMKSNNICIGYNPSRLVIHSGTRNEFTVERSQLCHIMPNGRSDVESNELPGLLTPSQAARLIRLNPLSAFVAVIKAIPIYPDSESQEAIQALSSHPDPTQEAVPIYPDPPHQEATVPFSTVAGVIASSSSTTDALVTPVVSTVTPDIGTIPAHLLGSLNSLFEEFSDIFNEKPTAGGALVDAPSHTIKLVPGSQPTFRRNHRFSPLELQELRKQVTELLSKGIITHSNSPFGAPAFCQEE